MPDCLLANAEPPVTLLTLNRPERRNALDIELCDAITAAAEQAVTDGARVLVVTGTGPVFSSGADLKEVYGQEFTTALYRMLHGLSRLPVPVIAAVYGPAIGGGAQLAIACDLRVADPGASFAIPVARNGLAVDPWTVRTLAALAGTATARRILLAAESVDAAQALACGLADRIGTLQDALSWAGELAGFAPLSLAHHKAVLNGWADDAAIAASYERAWRSADAAEAARARAQKRPPRFEGH